MAEQISKAIVLKIIDSSTNENDSFVDFFGKKGKFRLLAKGINKASSKNKANLLIGSVAEIEYFAARKYGSVGRLKKATTILNIDYSSSANLNFVIRAVKILDSILGKSYDIFDKYCQTLKHLGEGINKRLLLFVLANSLFSFGIGPIINKCVECQNTQNLADFEFYKGGFLCNVHSTKTRWNKELKSIYYMFYDLEKFIKMVNGEIVDKLITEVLDHLQSNGIYIF